MGFALFAFLFAWRTPAHAEFNAFREFHLPVNEFVHALATHAIDLPPDALDNPRLHAATNRFGAVVIPMRSLPYDSPMLDSGTRAWSSWWYPKSSREFTASHEKQAAILAKYDRWRGLAGESSALKAEKSLERPNPTPWEGLCDAWAIASISSPEPRKSVTRQTPDGKTVTFDVFDLKGLLLKTYEAVNESQFDFYGEKFLGNADGWVHTDLFPEQFHRLIEVYLGQWKRPLVMDRDPGIEVWSIPIDRANYRVEGIAGVPNMVIVRMWLYTAGPATLEQKAIPGRIEVVREYNYALKGTLAPNGDLIVNSGTWLKTPTIDSRFNHPDFIFAPKANSVERRSYNARVDIGAVDELLRDSY